MANNDIYIDERYNQNFNVFITKQLFLQDISILHKWLPRD